MMDDDVDEDDGNVDIQGNDEADEDDNDDENELE